MKDLLAGLKRWYRRRFRGFVAAPAGSGGTSWQQHQGTLKLHAGWTERFTCTCGEQLMFGTSDLKIISQDHHEGCEGGYYYRPCDCPITEARYVKICPKCRLGHWKIAEVKP